MPQFHTCNSLFLINREYFNGCMLRLVSNSPWIQTQSRPAPPRLLSVLFMQICIKFFQENIFLLHVTCCVQICKPPTTNTTDLLLNCEILCNMMFARVCVCRVCVCMCLWACMWIMIVLGHCSASWWTDRLQRRAADRRAGHSGDSRHFTSPGSVMRDRGHRRGPADTWVTLRDRVCPSSGLFVSLSNP